MVSQSIKLHALEEFNRALARPLSPSEQAGQAVEAALSGTGAVAAELFLAEESSRHSLLVCHRGQFPEAFSQITRFLPGQGYPGLVVAHREAIATDNLPGDERYLRTQVKELGLWAYFCLPLLLGERVLGCLNIAARRQGGITGADRQFLEGIGGGLSLALGTGRWRLAEVLAHREGEIGTEVTLEGVAAGALEAVAMACRTPAAALLFIPAPGGGHRLLASWGTWQEVRLPSEGLPEGCPARLSPRFSPCPEAGCPFGAGTSVCYPLRRRGEALGVLSLGYSEGKHTPVEALSLLPGLAVLLALGLGRLRHYSFVREQAIGEERQRLAREIHDGVVQSLGLLRVKAEYLSRVAEREPGRLPEELRTLHRLAGDTLQEVRRTLYSLAPAELEKEGLVASLHNLARQLGGAYRIPVAVQAEGREEAVPAPVRLHLLRFAQEALSNALRHSGAQRVELELRLDSSGCHLLVRDDGRGFDPEGARRGMGLLTMKERACSLGGRLILDSAPGRGTTLQMWLPGSR